MNHKNTVIFCLILLGNGLWNNVLKHFILPSNKTGIRASKSNEFNNKVTINS